MACAAGGEGQVKRKRETPATNLGNEILQSVQLGGHKTEERLKASIVAIRDCGRLRLQFIGYQHATQCRFWSRRCTGNYD